MSETLKNMRQFILAGSIVLAVGTTYGQVTDWHITGNLGTSPLLGNYVGTNDPNDLAFRTNSSVRLRINTGPLASTINGFGVATGGFLAAGPSNASGFWTGTNNGPFSRLHLGEPTNNGQQFGYRPWMRNGITLTGNYDQMYMGHKYTTDPVTGADLPDFSDAVIQWSDNPGTWLGDRMRFLFTSGYTGSATGNGSLEGLEGMRLKPAESGTEIFVGVGDYFAAAADPDERLDVLTRTIRVRELPNLTYEAPTSDDDKVVVVRADGRLNWRDANSLLDCDWTVTPGATGNHVWTAVGASVADCPDDAENVGIGLTGPLAKLTVHKNVAAGVGLDDVAGLFWVNISGGTKSAVDAVLLASGDSNFGYRAYSDGAGRNYGAHIRAGAGITGGLVTGGYFQADGELMTAHDDIKAVHGVAMNDLSGGTGWAAYFEGDGYLSNLPWSTSDDALKQNEEPISNALGTVLQIPPMTFWFNTSDFGFMGLSQDLQAGVMASDVEAVLPHLVRTIHRRADLDSLGNVLHPEMVFKAVSHIGLMPYVIGAVQEQNTMITALQTQVAAMGDQLAVMQDQLAACCASDGSGFQMAPAGGGQSSTLRGSGSDDGQLRIQPNPMNEAATITYKLVSAGQVRLIVSTSTGRQLSVLQDQTREAGTFTYEWNTSDLASGVYNVMLLVDGAPVVVKAVKIAR